MQKIQDIDCFFTEILMIKLSCNLTGREHILVNDLKLQIPSNCGKNTLEY